MASTPNTGKAHFDPAGVKIVTQVDRNLSWRTHDDVLFEWLTGSDMKMLRRLSVITTVGVKSRKKAQRLK